MDILDLCWRTLGSRRATLALLLVLILALSCGATLPQRSPGLSLDPPGLARWRADIQARYLRWADPLISLGLFSIRESFWFTIPLALLMVNVVLRTLDQFEAARRRHHPTLQDLVLSFAAVPQTHRFRLAAGQASTLRKLTELLEKRRYRVSVREENADGYLIAGRLAFTEWIIMAASLALVVIIVSVVLSPRLARREAGIALAPGQEHQLRYGPSLSVRLDRFQADLYPNGEARSYEADVTVLENGNEVASGRVFPARPLWYNGASLYQLSHGPLISIRATDTQGGALPMQTLAPSGTLLDKANLLLSEEETEGYLSVPDRNLLLRIVYQPDAAAENRASPSLLVQAYHGGTTELVFSDHLSGSGTLEIEGDSYTIDWGQYAVLGFTSDPTFAPMTLGAGVLLTSTLVAAFFKPQHVWAALRSQEGVVEVRLLDPREQREGMGTSEFHDLVAEIGRILRGT
jgi:cytochrome c biogenesis protein